MNENEELTPEEKSRIKGAISNYGSPMPEEISLGLYSNDVQIRHVKDFEGAYSGEIVKEYPKQVKYNYEVEKKLSFYKRNKIPVKFRLIFPKDFYESKGMIKELNTEQVILETIGVKIINCLWEIDIHTIYPLDYNPIVEFIRRAIPEEIINEVYKRANYKCQLKLEGCNIKAESIDHIIPISNGGGDNIENLQAACIHCNSKKGMKLLF